MASVIDSATELPALQHEEESISELVESSGESVLLHGVPWKLYRRLRKMRDNRNIRMTYDRGELELMSPSAEHEGIAALLGRLIDIWTLELAIPIRSCRTMTIKRAVLERGFEPDNCYYVQHEPQMWNKKKINFKNDPPPDLAIEVEVSNKLLDKIAIYAAFRVPELWSWRANTLSVLELSASGEYLPRATSVCFPTFSVAKAQEIVRQLGTVHETELVLSFRDWVRENSAAPMNARLGILVISLLLFPLGALAGENTPELPPRDALIARIDTAIGTLDKLYWSPTLGIWLDRTGDDLRAHYEGRLNPPWWSAANAVETLIDFMKATGRTDFDAKLDTLYELNRDPRHKTPRLIAELKRRKQWSDADERASKRRRHQTPTYTDYRNEYLDDSAWWGIAWLKMYDHTGTPKYLTTARAVQAHMAAAWRPDKGGGVMWCLDADKLKPNAITNSLFVILSARLYQRTHEPAYLDWAQRDLDWMHAKALYDGKGVVDAPGHRGDYWTYNQGAYIGALTALYQATGEAKYLDEAVNVADTALTRAGLVTADGVLVEKLGVGGWDPGLFKGIFARYLAQLRDVLAARKLHPETVRQIDRCLRASAASLLRIGLGSDGQYGIEWHKGAKDTTTRNFNTQASAMALFVSLLPDPRPILDGRDR